MTNTDFHWAIAVRDLIKATVNPLFTTFSSPKVTIEPNLCASNIKLNLFERQSLDWARLNSLIKHRLDCKQSLFFLSKFRTARTKKLCMRAVIQRAVNSAGATSSSQHPHQRSTSCSQSRSPQFSKKRQSSEGRYHIL